MNPTLWSTRPTPIASFAYSGTTTKETINAADGRCGIALVDGVAWWLGPQSHAWTPARAGISVVGVRIVLECGRDVAGEVLHRWTDRRAPLATVWRCFDVAGLERESACAKSDQARVGLLLDALERHLDGAPIVPDRARLSAYLAKGLPVSEVAAQLGIPPRHLHRRCRDDFGLSPVVLRRIGRLHRASRIRANTPTQRLAELAATVGYADQAHLQREVRALAGRTARQAFGP
jgi:AraC-like DNA-binding protein